MQRKLALILVALLLVCVPGVIAGSAGVESLLGKWQVVAQAPDRTMDLEFTFRQEGGQILGMASSIEGSVPLTAITFEDLNLAMGIVVGGTNYRLKGILKEGKLEGTWERAGSEIKGTWSAKRSEAPAPAAPAGGILGSWSSIAITPNGDMAATLEVRQEGEALPGMISSDMGSLPIKAVSFKENKFQFDLDLGGDTYRIQAMIEGDKLNGGWAPAAGGTGGPWRAARKAPAAPVPPATPGIAGSWVVVAATPEGNMKFVAEFKQTGDVLSGVLVAPDGSIPVQKASYANSRLTFEIDYMGGTYRIEAAIENDKLTGKWSAVGGGDSGTLSGERKKS